jgi:hypothetical protein
VVKVIDQATYWPVGNVADSMFDFLAVLSPQDFAQFNSINGSASGCTGKMTRRSTPPAPWLVGAELASARGEATTPAPGGDELLPYGP